MNILSQRLSSVKPSPTVALTARVAELQAIAKDMARKDPDQDGE